MGGLKTATSDFIHTIPPWPSVKYGNTFFVQFNHPAATMLQ